MLTFNQYTTAQLNESAYGTLEDAKTVVLNLKKHGFKGYLCGGCVRDLLTGHKPKDFDVATDATPDQVLRIFPEATLVGKQFGVVIAHGIDIATFRKDGVYTDGRRPDTVEYTTHAHEDSMRRDFSVNALFMDPFTHEILDFHNGKADAHNKVLRAVGNPDDRFQQDHLRMLRADRFAAKLGFEIHPETEASMVRNAHHISGVDVERIEQELSKALAHDAARTFKSMRKTGILDHVLPEVAALSSHDIGTVLAVLDHVPTNVSASLGFATITFKLVLATVKSLATRLKFSNVDRDHLLRILELQPQISAVSHHTTLDVLKRLMRMEHFEEALQLYGYRLLAHDAHTNSESYHLLTTMFAGMTFEHLHPEKFVTGDDLIKLGYKPGPHFKELLLKAENGQLMGTIKTKEQALDLIRSGKL